MTHGHVDGERRLRTEVRPETRSKPLVPAASVTEEEFSAAYERCFGRVYAYVSRRVNDRRRCERIVSEVLAANLSLLVDPAEERHELGQLKSASDRLIASESARSLSTDEIGS